MQPAFARAFAQLTTGIYVLTVREGERRHGMSSSWVTQVSGDPPLVMAAVDWRHRTHEVLRRTGRFALGIGLSHQIVIESMLGLSWAKPYSHMREYLAVLAPLVRTGSVSFAGEEFRVNANLAVPGAAPCPILVAALAPKMLALSGREADGTITWMTGPKTLREHTIPRINEAAAKAGRPAPRVVAGLPIALTTDRAGARAAASRIFQIYGALPSYRAMLDREGVEGPADVAIVGDRAALGEQLTQLRAIGVTDYLAIPYPVGDDTRASVEATREVLVDFLKR